MNLGRSTFIALSLGLLGIVCVQGQSLTPYVVTTTGEYFSFSGGSLSWTLGEVTSETLQNSAGIFTQGFQQPTPTTITGLAEADKIISVYPNPAREILYVKTTEDGDYLFELFNLQGQRIVDQSTTGVIGTHVQQIDLKDFRVALYLLRVSNITTGRTSIIRVEKY